VSDCNSSSSEDDTNGTSSEDDSNNSNNDDRHSTGTDINLSGLNRTPLYVGTDITTVVAMCLIMQFTLSNNFTDEAISKLLKLLHLLLLSPNHLPKSFYKFKKFFKQFSVLFSYSEVCTACSKCKEDCQCESAAQGSGHLVHISLVKPLSSILSNCWESSQFCSNSRDGILKDIWDGSCMVQASGQCNSKTIGFN